MKLELKHLAPYLPYGLEIKCESADMKILFTSDVVTSWGHYFYRYNYKPILRPLSELSESFQNLVDIMPFSNDYKISLFFEEKQLTKLTDLFIIKSSVATELIINKPQPLTAPYLAIQVLLENHFDVFNLIEQGLAIDINTVNQ